MYIQLLLLVRALVSPGREFSPWDMGSGCLVPLTQRPTRKRQQNKLLGKRGVTSNLPEEYPGMAPGTVGTWLEWALLKFSATMTWAVGKFSQRKGKSHSCCSNIPHSQMQLQNRNHFLSKAANSTHCETSCQSPGCYLNTIRFLKFAHYVPSLTDAFRFCTFHWSSARQ